MADDRGIVSPGLDFMKRQGSLAVKFRLAPCALFRLNRSLADQQAAVTFGQCLCE